MVEKNENSEKLLSDWLLRAQRKAYAHSVSAASFQKQHRRVGYLSAGFSAIATTLVSADLAATDLDSPWILVSVIVCSAAAAALTSIQTFVNFAEVQQTHSDSNRKYADLRRRIEQAMAFDDVDSERISAISDGFKTASEEEPSIPNKTWEATVRALPE